MLFDGSFPQFCADGQGHGSALLATGRPLVPQGQACSCRNPLFYRNYVGRGLDRPDATIPFGILSRNYIPLVREDHGLARMTHLQREGSGILVERDDNRLRITALCPMAFCSAQLLPPFEPQVYLLLIPNCSSPPALNTLGANLIALSLSEGSPPGRNSSASARRKSIGPIIDRLVPFIAA